MRTIAALRRELLSLHQEKSWRSVGEAFDIPGRTAHRIATSDYEPKRADIRFHLGLPALIPAPACLKCGQLHVSKRCPNGRKPPTNWRDGEVGWQRLVAWFQ